MKTKQTAVEWLEERLNLSIGYELKPLRGFFVIAKEMEKEQHNDTWTDSRIEDKGDDYLGKQLSFEEYYNRTFGGGNK